ncbi:cation-transporting P-type ATPase [Lactobacillus sp. PV037]|uniref:P-type ATPase n=1 Tax=unclassified Lactobacillus TaxID=2620435 RepID=UPI002240AD85|nr:MULTISPECIES: cation-transporting P-type ATPase [unclassified Lactobacillus]QNQ82741.1 cation-transporting P-type ATPase [Lactobacillus sp. PV012]QNQ83139.1 cation-transporting P-type ATPase [Lactobacillus sp. PV037]
MDTHKRPPAYTQDSAGVLQNLRTSLTGLSSQEAQRRLEENGSNELGEPPHFFLQKFMDGFRGIFIPKSHPIRQKKLSSQVMRDGELKEISSNQLVVGDIVYLEKGDNVPADIRLLETNNLQIEDKKHLICQKDADVILPVNTELDEHVNMAYHSTCVKNGSGVGIVVNTRLDNAEAPICLTGESHLIQTI